MMKELKPTQFGNPILRKKARPVAPAQIGSKKIQQLVADMRYTLKNKKLGVGLAAPQVGEGIALAVVQISPMPHRPKVTRFDLVLINPEITDTFDKKSRLWEGCISSGVDKNGLFAKVPRYKKVKVKFYDEEGRLHHKTYEGLPAHVIQHEVDHLNGVLFVDLVTDPKTYMTFAEYKKRIGNKKSKTQSGL